MKKWLTFKTIFFITVALLLTACGADNDDVNAPPENLPVEDGNTGNANDQTDTTEGEINFSSFDLDVEYDNNQSFEVDYENEKNNMEAKIEDKKNNRTLAGDEAFNELSSRFEKFTFDKTSADEEVIEQVSEAFELDENYKSLELEIQYADGTEKEYRK